MEGLIMTAQLILGLSLLVGVHEFGHLIAAKAFGMRVEQFSIGFPPKLFSFKYGETEYALSAIPLGGFVKISGMIDESMDKKQMQEEPKPWEFRSKPAWQRLIVMLGGIIVNVIGGVVIFIIMTYSLGETFVSKEEVNKHGIVAHELGKELGFQTGDKILNISGKDFERFSEVQSPDLLLSSNAYYTVLRDGEETKIDVPSNFIDRFGSNQDVAFIDPAMPFTVGQVLKNSGADEAGLQEGDRIESINGKPIQYFHEAKDIISSNPAERVSLTVERNGNTQEMTAQVSEEGTIGFSPNPLWNISRVKYSPGEAITQGTNKAFNVVWVNIRAFGKMFRGELDPRKSLSGPIGIAQTFGGDWNWIRFWNITGLLSMVLAFMNLLPIPALDGGHVMFLTSEIVSGRKPSDRFLEVAQKVGMVLLLSLMAFVILNDITKLF